MTTQDKHRVDPGTEELRLDVDRARHELGDTVERLAAKADVKAMARQKAEDARDRARDAAASAWRAAGSEKTVSWAMRGGIVVGAAGAVAAAVWMRGRMPGSMPVAIPVAMRGRMPGRMRGSMRRRGMRWTPLGGGRKAPFGRKRGRGGPFGRGRGHGAPIQVRFRTGQKRAVQVRRRRGKF